MAGSIKSRADGRGNRRETEFDLVAPLYPALEWWAFGHRLDDARLAFYDAVLRLDRILLAGEGNGRFLRSLLTRKTGGCVDVVDKSGVMLRLAEDRIRSLGPVSSRVRFIQAGFRHYTTDQQFDCVVTHFLLDLFKPPAQRSLIERIAELTATNATWINVDFVPPVTLRGRALMWLQYNFFRNVSRTEASRCFDETAITAQTNWAISETSSNVQANQEYFVSDTQPASMGALAKATDKASTIYQYTPYQYPHPLDDLPTDQFGRVSGGPQPTPTRCRAVRLTRTGLISFRIGSTSTQQHPTNENPTSRASLNPVRARLYPERLDLRYRWFAD